MSPLAPTRRAAPLLALLALPGCCLPIPSPPDPAPAQAPAPPPGLPDLSPRASPNRQPTPPAPADPWPEPRAPLPLDGPACTTSDKALCDAVLAHPPRLRAAAARLDAGISPDCPCTSTTTRRKLGSYIPIVQDFMKSHYRTFTNVEAPLYTAISRRNDDLTLLLLSRGAHPGRPGPNGQTPLDAALASDDDTDTARLLLGRGADARLIDLGAVDTPDTARALIRHGADPRSLDITLLKGHEQELSWLLSQRPDLSDEDPNEVLRLDLATLDGLLSGGLPLTLQDPTWDDPLLIVAIERYPDAVPLLLDRGASPKTASGKSPKDSALCVAASHGRAALIPLLVQAGARVNDRCDWDKPPLAYAANNGHVDAARALIDLGADVNARIDGTPLLQEIIEGVIFFDPEAQISIQREEIDAIRLLVDRGATFKIGGKDACQYLDSQQANGKPASAELRAAVCR